MFGDPVQNPMRWEKTELGNLCKEVRYGTSKPASENGKYTYLRMNNITYEGELDLTNIKSIDISDDELPKCSVKKGDILFNRTNSIALCGKTCLYKLDETMVIAGYIIRVRVNEKLNPQYVSTFFNTKSIKKMLKEMAKGAVNQANINAQEMQSIQIPVPPISLQNEYESFVQQIDKSKFEMAIYEKLWYNYQIWRKKMGLFRGIFDLFSTWTISDKFGLGAGFLYADYAWEKANERELNKMKAGVTQTITNYINENRKLLNDDLIQILNTFINSIANCNKFNANSILSELKNFLMHKCAYHSCIIEILNHSIEAIESIPEDNLDDGVKIQALQKTKNVIDCSDSNQLPILLKDLFSFYDENGIEVENKEELFDKFESLRKEYLA